MTAGNFDKALKLVLVHEGGYVDHPSDPGGATNMGITIGTLSGWRGRTVSKAEVKNLTRAEAAKIYRKNYWDAIKGDDLPSGVDYAVFDFCVNSGRGRAAPFLQDVLKVAKDGVIGPITLAAARQMDAGDIVNDLCDDRLAWLRRLPTWRTFGKGWTNRITGVRREALAMAKAAPAEPQEPPRQPPDVPKDDAKPQRPPMEPADDEKPSVTGTVVGLAFFLFFVAAVIYVAFLR